MDTGRPRAVAIAAKPQAMARRRLGIGVVGTGGWARGFWAEAQKAPEVKLVACWNRTRERAEVFAERYGGEVAQSLEALIAHPQVEAIANFSANNFHCQPTLMAAAAGKHVFVDKPIANTVEESAKMIEACRRAGVTLMVGHSTRYSGTSRALKALVESGRLGQIAMVEANVSHSGGTRLGEGEWRWHWEEAPGGPLMQLSIHAFDTLHYLFGPTKRATALSVRDLLPSEIEDVFLVLLEFESGLLVYVGTNYLSPPAHFLRVYGRGGNAFAERSTLVFWRPKDDWSVEPEEIAIPEVNPPAAEMTEFARAVRTRTEPETGGKEGLLALGVVWACIKSAEEKRAIEVREVLGEAAEFL
jgi:predicted dehydrogenase